MDHSCAALDNLVAFTQAYVDAIKHLNNLSTVDIDNSKDVAQAQWLKQVESEIVGRCASAGTVTVRTDFAYPQVTAACMVVKLGGPNETTLVLPCQRPELRALYIKYELLKASISTFRVKAEQNVPQSNGEANRKAVLDSTFSEPSAYHHDDCGCKACGKRPAGESKPACIHADASETIDNPLKSSVPQGGKFSTGTLRMIR